TLASRRAFAPRWRITCTQSLARSWKVANHSDVRKLGAFHLMPSAMPGSAPRMVCRRARTSCLNGCSSATRNASTLSGSRAAGFLRGDFKAASLCHRDLPNHLRGEPRKESHGAVPRDRSATGLVEPRASEPLRPGSAVFRTLLAGAVALDP